MVQDVFYQQHGPSFVQVGPFSLSFGLHHLRLNKHLCQNFFLLASTTSDFEGGPAQLQSNGHDLGGHLTWLCLIALCSFGLTTIIANLARTCAPCTEYGMNKWIWTSFGYHLEKKSTVVFTTLNLACRTHSTLNTDSPLHGELPLGSFPGVFQPLNLQVATSNAQLHNRNWAFKRSANASPMIQKPWELARFFMQFPGLSIGLSRSACRRFTSSLEQISVPGEIQKDRTGTQSHSHGHGNTQTTSKLVP